jgi:hypothetical protein
LQQIAKIFFHPFNSTDFDKEQEYISSSGFQHTGNFEHDDGQIDQSFGVDSDEEADEDAAFGEEWKEFRRAFPTDKTASGATFENEATDTAWAMREPKDPFEEEDEVVNEEDPFATRGSDPFSQEEDGDGFGKDDDDFGGFVGASDDTNVQGTEKDTQDPFSQFEQEARKEVSWSSFANDFGEFEKLKVTNVESPTVEVLTQPTEAESTGSQDVQTEQPSEARHS